METKGARKNCIWKRYISLVKYCNIIPEEVGGRLMYKGSVCLGQVDITCPRASCLYSLVWR
jgi:hypothetical protein